MVQSGKAAPLGEDPTVTCVLDAARERERATFSVQQMANYVNDGAENIAKREKFAKQLSSQPWSEKSRRYFLTREEEYVGALRAATEIWSRMVQGELSQEDALLVRSMVDMPGGLELHLGMFIPSIVGQGSKEQQRELLPKCNTLQIIGTYAQTELGHGTFVRGLETTATFNRDRQSFTIHSPTQTATKWWPGGLGKTATHAVVMARLFINGRDFGPHGFVVQLRDLESHLCLPGIEIGDIGPKFGYNGVDNGFMRFDRVEIPRTAMLSKFSEVLEDGTYKPPPKENKKASYSTMLFVRADIVRLSARYLGKAVTIAIRYCCVRRQTADEPGKPELQVIDYENTSATLLPLVAASYVMHAAGRTLWAAYKDYEDARKRGSFESLPELHALSSGLKALTTECTSNGIEACRRVCGGHGYSLLSGLPTLFASYVQNCTWEGDNNVLLLQTARYIVKAAARVAARGDGAGAEQLPEGLRYLRGLSTRGATDRAAPRSLDLRDDAMLLEIFERRACHLVGCAINDLRSHPAAGGELKLKGATWNSSTVSLINAARAHCELALLRNYQRDVSEAKASLGHAEVAALRRVGWLWAVQVLMAGLGEFLECKAVSVDQGNSAVDALADVLFDDQTRSLEGAILQARLVHDTRRELLRELRPDAISLVDAWAFTDYELNSALGRYDGDVYNELLRMAKSSPLNDSQEGPAWEPVLKPAMQRMRAKL